MRYLLDRRHQREGENHFSDTTCCSHSGSGLEVEENTLAADADRAAIRADDLAITAAALARKATSSPPRLAAAAELVSMALPSP